MSGLEVWYLFVYVLFPVALMALLAWRKPKWLPVSALICLMMNFFVFGMYLLYYEVRVQAMSLILIQPAAVFVIALGLQSTVQIFRTQKSK